MTCSLIWSTTDGDNLLAHIARVSNPANQNNPNIAQLIQYMFQHKHWSPFEMVSACIEINTSRDIGRQILRHRSFSFQEFSQRYSDVTLLQNSMIRRECRLQDPVNRQNSIPTDDPLITMAFNDAQDQVWASAMQNYHACLDNGIAKEQVRALLPEGLTPTRMYMSGTLRSWIHYLEIRTGEETQKEHRLIAESILAILLQQFPVTIAAFLNN